MLLTHNDNINDINYEINMIYKNYYNKNNKFKNNMRNDFIQNQVDIVKRILNIAKNENHLKIAYIFAKQLI
jgi:hypothetical protein